MPPLRRIFIAAIVVLLLLITGTHYVFEGRRIAQLNAAIEESQALLDEKRQSVRDHQERVAFYKTQEGIEHLARERYNLVLPGERMILLRSGDASFTDTPPGGALFHPGYPDHPGASGPASGDGRAPR